MRTVPGSANYKRKHIFELYGYCRVVRASSGSTARTLRRMNCMSAVFPRNKPQRPLHGVFFCVFRALEPWPQRIETAAGAGRWQAVRPQPESRRRYLTKTIGFSRTNCLGIRPLLMLHTEVGGFLPDSRQTAKHRQGYPRVPPRLLAELSKKRDDLLYPYYNINCAKISYFSERILGL